jgi:hypothetical protein
MESVLPNVGRFSGLKIPLQQFMSVVRSCNAAEPEKSAVFPLMSLVLNSSLSSQKLDMDALSGYQLKIFSRHESLFQALSNLSKLPSDERLFLGEVFDSVGKNLKANRSPYIVGGESEPIFAKDFPSDGDFTFGEAQKAKIAQTREFLQNHTDGVSFYEKRNTIFTTIPRTSSMKYVQYHLFILEKDPLETNKVAVNF